MKTNSSAKKRFKITASGKIKHKQAGKRHNMGRKGLKRLKLLKQSSILSESKTSSIIKYKMPNSK